MAVYFGNTKIGKIFCGDKQIKNIYHGDILVYSSAPRAVAVTYYVDNGISYTENVLIGDNVLSPSTFIPEKNGWEFIGWRQDTAAGADVLTGLTMGDEPITLYAVFRKLITVSYYNGSVTKQMTTGYRYYNNLTIVNPTFTIAQVGVTNFTTRGWSTGTTGDAVISYPTISGTPFDADITLYGMYQQNITLSYNGNGNTSGTTAAETKVRYYNSGSNAYVNPTFTVKANGFAKTAYSFVRWRLNSTSGTAYSPNNTLTLTANAILYAEWTYSGAPFYIVQDFTCKQTVTWTVLSRNNASGGAAINFTVGSPPYATISSGFTDSTREGNFVIRSQSISTNGNKTLLIEGITTSRGTSFDVNGVTKEYVNGGGAITFDVSAGSFTIQANVKAWGYQSGGIFFQFGKIYLY